MPDTTIPDNAFATFIDALDKANARVAERLLPWLRALSKAGVQVLIADPGRNYFPKTGVTKLATYSVPTSLELEDRELRQTSVYELQAS